MAIVRFEHVSKKFGKTEVIHDLSFETKEGEFSFILGPSGAGKTTILSLIAGILPLNGGKIYINDTLMNDLKPRDRNVAIAFESYALYPNRTVYGNIKFPLDSPLRKNDLTDVQKDQKIHEIARLLQIEELLERFPKELSGGQRQRVALGRTLIRQPSIYLLDEPIAHLDAKLRHQMRGELKRLQQSLNIPFICTSPDQAEAVAMADRIFVLNKGRLEQEGSADELYFHPCNEFVALMLGDPKMSIVEAQLEKKGESLYLVNSDVQIKVPQALGSAIKGKDFPGILDIGIRPTDMEVSMEPKEGFDGFIIDFFQVNGEKRVITALKGATKIVVEAENLVGSPLEIGQKIYLSWNSEHPYLFDRNSKVSLV